jgi:hyperosmotically inducible protein
MQLTALSAVLMLLASAMGASAQTPQKPQAPATPATPAGQDQKDRTLGKVISDAWITMKIHSLYINEDALENSNIDVDTRNGAVTLSGTVASDAGRNRASEIAKMTDGVKSVSNAGLRVAPARSDTAKAGDAGKRAGRTVNDGWIKSKIYSQFLVEEFLMDSDIDIDVANGMVTLAGTVRTSAARERAAAVAKATEGVKGVKNTIKVTAK